CSVLSPTVSTAKRRRWRADQYRSNEERSRGRAGVRLLSRSMHEASVTEPYHRDMTTAAVIFGGPSDEHDISILTGLQVARALPGDPPTFYWSKAGEWYRVDPEAEAADFVDGVPRKAREVSFVAAPGGGFVQKRRPVPIDVALIACHGGPGEDGTLQGALDLARIRYTG